eukprot:3243804-Pyramimonas_sp.AAC.1
MEKHSEDIHASCTSRLLPRMKGSRRGRRRARRLRDKGIPARLARLTDYDFEDSFLGGIGRGKGSGKRARDVVMGEGGTMMACNTCGGVEHFQAQCSEGSGEKGRVRIFWPRAIRSGHYRLR